MPSNSVMPTKITLIIVYMTEQLVINVIHRVINRRDCIFWDNSNTCVSSWQTDKKGFYCQVMEGNLDS